MSRPSDRIRAVASAVVLAPVHLWRWTVAVRQPRCRFHPSCSTYAVTAVRTHGPVRGTGLAVRRLGRCHPWNPGGVDHVPPARTATGIADSTSTPISTPTPTSTVRSAR